METKVLKDGPGAEGGKLGLGVPVGGGEGVTSYGKKFRGRDKELVKGMVDYIGHTLMDINGKKT